MACRAITYSGCSRIHGGMYGLRLQPGTRTMWRESSRRPEFYTPIPASSRLLTGGQRHSARVHRESSGSDSGVLAARVWHVTVGGAFSSLPQLMACPMVGSMGCIAIEVAASGWPAAAADSLESVTLTAITLTSPATPLLTAYPATKSIASSKTSMVASTPAQGAAWTGSRSPRGAYGNTLAGMG